MEYLLNVVFQNLSTQPNQAEIGMSKQARGYAGLPHNTHTD